MEEYEMKKSLTILLAILSALSFTACAGGNGASETESAVSSRESSDEVSETEYSEPSSGFFSDTSNDESQTTEPAGESSDEYEHETGKKGSKILVAYFSATGNTEGVAQKLAEELGADIYEIVPEQPYTDEDLNYSDSSTRATREQNDPDARPAISGSVENMEQYDTVLIGYPIWWGEAPRIMSTFIESYDFSEKTLAAFCTSSGSGFGGSDSALRKSASNAAWLEGHRFPAGASADEVTAWANEQGIR